MEFIQLKVLTRIIGSGNIQETSKELGLSAATIRGHLRDLERDLGCSLFLGKDNYQFLSPEGEMVVRRAEKILSMEYNLRSRMREGGGLNSDVLLVAENAAAKFAPVISKFMTLNPQIRVKITQMKRRSEQRDIHYDLRAYLSRLPVNGPGKITLMKAECFLAVSRDHNFANGGYRNLIDAKEEKFILPPPSSEMRQIIDGYFAQAGFRPNVVMELDIQRVVHKMVGENMGVSILSPLIELVEKDEPVVLVPIRNPESFLYLNLQWNDSGRMSQAALEFRDYILRTFRVRIEEK